jgi:3-hydroxybutyryl-CoA dehydratase
MDLLENLTLGANVAIELSIGSTEMQAFRALSGDHNPIHHDAEFARARGFAGPIVYGGLIVAAVSRLLGSHLPGPGCVWHSLKMEFRSPLGVGEAALVEGRVVHVNPDVGTLRLSIEVRAGERLVAKGDVQALLARARS